MAFQKLKRILPGRKYINSAFMAMAILSGLTWASPELQPAELIETCFARFQDMPPIVGWMEKMTEKT